MSDDLSAFFAKKAQKNKDKKKKKGVVSLEDVGQQLERKVKIQETREYENEDFIDFSAPKPQHESSVGVLRVQQNDDDSEWIDYSKPAVSEITYKDYIEQPDEEIEEESKGNNAENLRTWNVVEKKDNDENEVKVPVKSVYQPPGQARRQLKLDINSEEMFPSIGQAEQIAEKIKSEEKKKTQAAIKTEDQFEVKTDSKARRTDRYEPRLGGDRYEPRSGGDRYEPRSGGDRYEPRSGGDRYVPRSGGDRYEPRSGGDRYEPRSGGDRYEPRSGGGRYNQERNGSSQDSGMGRSGPGMLRNTSSRYETSAYETTSAADESSTWRKAPTERRDQNPTGYQSQRQNYESRVSAPPSSDGDTWRRAPATRVADISQTSATGGDVKSAPNRYIPPRRRNQPN